MTQHEVHFNPPGLPGEIGCSATSGPWTTALVNVTCAVCQLLYGPEYVPLDEQVPVIVSASEIIGGAEVSIGEPRESTISRGALDLLHGQAVESPLDERRQRAREAAHDEIGPNNVIRSDAVRAIEAAIETATRVRVRGGVYEAGFQAYDASGLTHSGAIMETIIAVLRAAGFEVEE